MQTKDDERDDLVDNGYQDRRLEPGGGTDVEKRAIIEEGPRGYCDKRKQKRKQEKMDALPVEEIAQRTRFFMTQSVVQFDQPPGDYRSLSLR